MNQRIKLQSNYNNYNNHSIFQNLHTGSAKLSYGKTKSYQTSLSKQHVRNDILRVLPENVFEDLLAQMDLVYFEAGEYLYQPEDPINYFYFPETAIISDFQILHDGKTMEVAMTGREGMVGVSSVFTPHASLNWIQTSIPGKVWRIDAQTFRQKFNTSDSLQKLTFDYLNFYIAQISQKVICNSHHSVEERLCCWLLMVSDRCGLNSLPLTQEQIAGFLGVHRPSVTLITQSLRDSGIINYLRGKISILDKVRLEFTSCDCYSNTKVM